MSGVLVIIVTYNASEWLKYCLSSIPSEDSPVKGLVIDNGSADNTVEIIRNDYPHIELIENNKNLGFGAANNIGFRYAIENGYDYVYLLNQDAWINPDDILKLITIAERNKEYGLLSPLQVNRGGNRIDSGFMSHIAPQMIEDFILNGKGDILYEAKDNGRLQAAHWLVSTEVIKRIGGFSPIFYHYGEDDNYCDRLCYFGYKIGIVPSVYGVHDRGSRKINIDSQLYRRIQLWKTYLSNPNTTIKRGMLNVLETLLRWLPIHRFRLMKPFFLLMVDIKVIADRKKQSKGEGAFLNYE